MPFRENAPDKRVHFLRLLRRRGASSADGPDRFVSNDDTVEVRGCQPGQTPDNLLFDRIEGLSLIALLKCFADTNDYTQSGGQPSVCFLADNLIDLKKVLSPFGMPDNHMRATGIVHHESSDFTRERAFAPLARAVLCRHFDVRSFQTIGDALQCSEDGCN